MGALIDAILCGPVALGEYIVNEACCVIADIICAAETKKEESVEETPSVENEIVEYKNFKETVDSSLNVNFSTVDEKSDDKLAGDELINTVESIVEKTIEKSELNLDGEEKHIKFIAISTLLADDKTTFANVFNFAKELGIENRDNQVELNTLFKWMTGTKLIKSESTVQLNEFISAQLLFETLSVIADMNDWGLEANIGKLLSKAKRRYDNEIASNGKLAGDDGVDPISPISFNQGILNTAFSPRKPKMKPTVEEYIKQYILGILPQDWVHDYNVDLKIDHVLDPYDVNRDTGRALLEVMINGVLTGARFDIDLDSISGNGYCIAIGAFINSERIPVYVNIERFPKIVAKAILSKDTYTLNNPRDNDSIIEFNEVMKDSFDPVILSCYDLSGMSKHLSFMTNEEKKQFSDNLLAITYANWEEMGPQEHMYRMRIRKFDNPNKFTLVSDCNTRQQFGNFLDVIGKDYKKYFKEDTETDPSILVCKFDNGNLDVSLNGAAMPNIRIPSKALNMFKEIHAVEKEEESSKTSNQKVPFANNFNIYGSANPALDFNGNIRPEFLQQPTAPYPYSNYGYQQPTIFNPTINGNDIVR